MEKLNCLKRSIVCIITIIMSLIVTACSVEKGSAPIPSIAEISVNDMGEDYKTYHIEQLYVLEKYAFITADEYEDIESGYSDITYRVYTADQPMDKYELFEEYYIVMFQDNSGEFHLASLSIRDFDISEQLAAATSEEPQIISANVAAAAKYNITEFNSRDKEINMLTNETLNAYSAEHNIPYEGILMIYK